MVFLFSFTSHSNKGSDDVVLDNNNNSDGKPTGLNRQTDDETFIDDNDHSRKIDPLPYQLKGAVLFVKVLFSTKDYPIG